MAVRHDVEQEESAIKQAYIIYDRKLTVIQRDKTKVFPLLDEIIAGSENEKQILRAPTRWRRKIRQHFVAAGVAR